MTLSRPPALHLLLTGASLLGLGLVVSLTGIGTRLASGLAEVDQGDTRLLAAAAVAFAVGLAGCGLAWRAGLCAAGTPTTRADATSRYVTGSLVNALVPLRAGGAVRLALYVRSSGSVRAVAAVASAIGSARTAGLAAFVLAASATAPVPMWPVALLGGAAVGAAALSLGLGRSVAELRAIAGWMSAALLARLVGASFVAAAFGTPRPVLAGIAVVAAVELASTLPLTPGNVGLSSAAVAFVLVAQGLPDDVAVAAGIALALLETSAALVLGLCGLAYLTRPRGSGAADAAPGLRRRLRPRLL